MAGNYEMKHTEQIGNNFVTEYDQVIDHDGVYLMPYSFIHKTTAERDAMQAYKGFMIYNTDTNQPEFFDGAVWHGMKAA